MNLATNWLGKCITKEQDKITNAVLQNQEQEEGKRKMNECHKMSHPRVQIIESKQICKRSWHINGPK